MRKIAIVLLFSSVLFSGCEELFDASERYVVAGRLFYEEMPLKEVEVAFYAIAKLERNYEVPFGEIQADHRGTFLVGITTTDQNGFFKCGFPTSQGDVFFMAVEGKYYGYWWTKPSELHNVQLGDFSITP